MKYNLIVRKKKRKISIVRKYTLYLTVKNFTKSNLKTLRKNIIYIRNQFTFVYIL